MELLAQFADFFVHLDQHLGVFVEKYGAWIYALLFAIIFCETGLVVTPILPGDSLLFVAGALAAVGHMNVHLLVALLIAAAVLGNTVNYHVGRWLAPRVFRGEESRWFNRKYIDRTHAFFEKHGGKTIVMTRFMPIIRTYAPFVAGMGAMTPKHFAAYNVLGAVLWVTALTYPGYWFGDRPWIKQNLSWLVLVIVLVSISPALYAFVRQWWRQRRPNG